MKFDELIKNIDSIREETEDFTLETQITWSRGINRKIIVIATRNNEEFLEGKE